MNDPYNYQGTLFDPAPKQIEDQREPGKMSYAEWKKLNGVE